MTPPTVRCAVYTRKSSDEGLEQSFNSLHAQREACEAYILSQKHEGWLLVPTPYDDGGFSGGSMERPGLKALLADLDAGLIDTIVVYKVDRLTRSLADFAKMVELLDARGASFVSVTQAFNTTTSMGRLTLNVLLSFAQFEREVTGERIRDKIAASKAKGMWMGGLTPLGYDSVERTLVVNEGEAEQVRELFRLYLAWKAVDDVVAHAAEAGFLSKSRTTSAGVVTGGTPLTRGSLYKILSNPVYVGEIGHKDKRYPGQHAAIVDRKIFDDVQALLASNRRKHRGRPTAKAGALLAGILFDPTGDRLTSTHTSKGDKRYRYYAHGELRVPAKDLEAVFTDLVVSTLASPAKLAACLPDLALYSDDVGKLAKGLSERLLSGTPAKRRAAALDIVERVILDKHALSATLNLAPLGLSGSGTISAATALGRPASRLTLVVPGAGTAPKSDPALIAVVAQARQWFEQLASGKANTYAALAAEHGVTGPYVRHLIGAAFLAPDLVTRIVEGRQPAGLTVAKLRTLLPLPSSWPAQRELFAALN